MKGEVDTIINCQYLVAKWHKKYFSLLKNISIPYTQIHNLGQFLWELASLGKLHNHSWHNKNEMVKPPNKTNFERKWKSINCLTRSCQQRRLTSLNILFNFLICKWMQTFLRSNFHVTHCILSILSKQYRNAVFY